MIDPAIFPTSLAVDPASLAEVVDAIAITNDIGTLATCRADGALHTSILYFAVTDSLKLLFVSDPETRHIEQVSRDPLVAVTIFSSDQPWGTEHHGLQFEGEAHEVGRSEFDELFGLYADRFPAVLDIATNRDELEANFGSKLYEVAVTAVTVTDETKIPGTGQVTTKLVRSSR
jgi:uncharacterized protein YhbP (UPF0306 family)